MRRNVGSCGFIFGQQFPRRFNSSDTHFSATYRMTNSQRLAKVRERLLGWLAEEAADPCGSGRSSDRDAVEAPCDQEIQPKITGESMLIRDEYFCGRKFRMANHTAIWFIEEDQLKIYAKSGELLCVLSGSEIDEPANRQRQQAGDTANNGPAILKMPNATESPEITSDGARRAA